MFIYPVDNSAESFTSYIPVLLLTVSKRKSLGHILWGLGTIIMRRKKTNQIKPQQQQQQQTLTRTDLLRKLLVEGVDTSSTKWEQNVAICYQN